MKKKQYLPKRDSQLDIFEENFKNKLTTHSAALGINASEVSEILVHIDNHRTSYAGMISKRAESKAAKEENLMKKRILIKELGRISSQIKKLKGYTPAIGDDLGIIGSETTFKDPSDLKPDLNAKLNGSEIVIRFKKEDSDGVKIYSRRGNETEFTFLTTDTQSPYNDNRPKLDPSKPEQREYYAFYFDEDTEVGIQSDILKAIVP